MSYILDALRKSERERSLGDTPRLTFSVVDEETPARPAWVWALVAVLGVAVGVLGAMQLSDWWQTSQESAEMVSRPPPAPVPVPEPAPRVVVAEPEADPEPQPATAVETPAPKRQPVKVNTPSGPVEVDMPVAAPEKKAEKAPVKPEPAPALAVPPPSEAAVEYEAARDGDEPPVWEVDEPVPEEEPAPVEEEDYIVTYYGLPAATRKSLGELAMNAHVYSSTPGRGFVIINGGKYREGDVLNEGAVVDEIRQDGVVLEYRNELFLLPVPR